LHFVFSKLIMLFRRFLQALADTQIIKERHKPPPGRADNKLHKTATVPTENRADDKNNVLETGIRTDGTL